MIYVCAGMTRSGSTWLFNAVRVLLKHSGAPDLAGGYIGQIDELLTHKTAIIKIHPFNADLAAKADVILTAHRDPRDVAASMQRHYQQEYSIVEMNEWVKGQVKWAQHAAYDMHYEDLLVDRLTVVKDIAAVLKLSPETLESLPYEDILREIEGEKFQKGFSETTAYDAVNLLHEGHVTDGRHGSWNGVLRPELIAAIEKEFRGWMAGRGYQPSSPKTDSAGKEGR
jgi:hypothetical protein